MRSSESRGGGSDAPSTGDRGGGGSSHSSSTTKPPSSHSSSSHSNKMVERGRLVSKGGVKLLGVCMSGSWVCVCQALGCAYVWLLHVCMAGSWVYVCLVSTCIGVLVDVKLLLVCYIWMYMCSSGSPNCLETQELKVH
uniref:Uncharacterized protein n=1 Tax=Cacopsylla melanoneura TaxID=428564 RepID=A0A8D8QL11_9HEMI